MDAFIENANKKTLAFSASSVETVERQKQGVFRQAFSGKAKTRGKMPSGENAKLMKWPGANRLSLVSAATHFLRPPALK